MNRDLDQGQAKRQSEADREDRQKAARVIVQCMRAGLVSAQNVRYCASLGDEVCSIIFPNRQEMSVRGVLGINDQKFSAGFAVWCAEGVLDIWHREFPKDNRPRLAIDAANTWLEDPSEENARTADAAGDAATRAAAADAAGDAADAAAAAARAADAAYWAAGDAARAAAWAAGDAAAWAAGDAAARAACNAAAALGNTT